MDILYLLIPLSLVFVAVIALVFLWAVKSGQFEDMEGPAHRILMDDDSPVVGRDDIQSPKKTDNAPD
jgi:cbb3-type cytochrome oxidase maturation protein